LYELELECASKNKRLDLFVWAFLKRNETFIFYFLTKDKDIQHSILEVIHLIYLGKLPR